MTAGSLTSFVSFRTVALGREAKIKIAVCTLLVGCFCVRTFSSWRNWGDLDHASGTWIAMAVDARDGVLYRPIVSDIGYGGTRYAPLHVLVHASLMKLGIDPLAAGYLIGIVSAAALMGAMFQLMRRLEVAPGTAVVMCCVLLSGHCLAVGVAGIRGDLPAAALDLCGVAAVAGAAIPLAAICFVLALATKVTCIFGVVASVAWLACTGRRRQAVRLAAMWIIGAALVVLLTQWISHGRAAAIFAACADGGGELMTLLLAPLAMVNNAIHYDPLALLMLIVALLLLPGHMRAKSLPVMLLLVTLVGTVTIFGTPGTNINHLIDLHAAVIVFLATRCTFSRGARTARPVDVTRRASQATRLNVANPNYSRVGRFTQLATAAPLLLAGAAAILCLEQTRHIQLESRSATAMAVLADVARSPVPGPILSENPLLPLVAGQRPYLLDAYMFRVLGARRPSLADKMWDDLRHQRFSAVVIYSRHSFGREFMDRLSGPYALVSQHDDYEIYFPRPR